MVKSNILLAAPGQIPKIVELLKVGSTVQKLLKVSNSSFYVVLSKGVGCHISTLNNF